MLALSKRKGAVLPDRFGSHLGTNGEVVVPAGRIDVFDQFADHALVVRADVLNGHDVELADQVGQVSGDQGAGEFAIVKRPEVERGDPDRFSRRLDRRRGGGARLRRRVGRRGEWADDDAAVLSLDLVVRGEVVQAARGGADQNDRDGFPHNCLRWGQWGPLPSNWS